MTGRWICTCHSHQFVECRGQGSLGAGWQCEDVFRQGKPVIQPALVLLGMAGSVQEFWDDERFDYIQTSLTYGQAERKIQEFFQGAEA